ncbi:Transposase [Shigella dysenteriae 1617]|uniref:Transposase n=1 Tax=Shigella dysenteriae 1617 TaxID=754093 RepID=A0A0A6ZTJ5_SHIDY|nr:Transposase [Shigella dysenteriae 1617]
MPKRITSLPVAHADVALICELDEQWSFVGSKARQHWLWYAYNTKTRLRPLLMLMWRLSANLMSNGVRGSKPGNTGSGTRITPKQGGNYWHCLRHSTSACSPATTGAAMAGRCRRISI